MPQVSDSPVDEMEEMEEEEILEEETEAADDNNNETKKRPRFHKDNQYIFPSLEEAKEGQKNLLYEDETEVDPNAFRPFKMTRNVNGNLEDKGFILAKSSGGAAAVYLTDKGFDIGLAEPKSRGGGRGKSKIEQTVRTPAITAAVTGVASSAGAAGAHALALSR